MIRIVSKFNFYGVRGAAFERAKFNPTLGGYIKAKLLMITLEKLHVVQRGIWVPTKHLLWDQGKPRKTLIELAGRRTFRMQTDF
jgi:hypothetical protein